MTVESRIIPNSWSALKLMKKKKKRKIPLKESPFQAKWVVQCFSVTEFQFPQTC